MTAAELLARVDGVRKTSQGWVARCTVHDDRHPSLAIAETADRILLNCRAGCTTESVVAALGLTFADLFFDRRGVPSRRASPSEPRTERPEDLEYRLWSCALGLRLRALAVFDAASGCDVSGWTDTDRDRAMRYVIRAHDDLRQAQVCDALAVRLREEILAARQRGNAA